METNCLQIDAGHISLGLNKVKTSNHSFQQRHFGFWPAIELTIRDILFDYPAQEKSSLDQEIHYSNAVPPYVYGKCYNITLNREQYKKIKKEIKNQSDNITLGKTRYALLAPLLNHLRSNSDVEKTTSENLENCSTIATRILNAGEIPIRKNNLLWGISPTELGHQLDSLISENKIQAIVEKHK